MLAGGMVIAAPSMVPEAAAAGTLYVSAENAMFENTFGGAQIVEVIVIDPNRSQTDESVGEPVVKVDENQLRMAQGVDGNWYAYFGDETKVEAADAAVNNLNFGINDNPTLSLGDFAEASDVTQAATDGVIRNAPTLSSWNGSAAHAGTATGYDRGQIGVQTAADWPFIQLYDLTIETFDIVYEQAGADERVTLNFNSGDLDDYAGLELDRNGASQQSEIHLVITDNQLNIDPTAEDIVIFYVGTSGQEGVSFTNRTDGYASTDYINWSNSFDDNGKLKINNNTSGAGVILANDATLDDTTADNYMVFFEGGENSGIFYNTDDNDDASLIVANGALRGTAATFDYNDSAQSFIVTNDFGVINMDESSVGDEWNSGEAIAVTLIDQDLNKNTASDEDLLLVNTTNGHLVPSLQIGNPLMVTSSGSDVAGVSDYSNIAYYTNASLSGIGTTANYTINTGYTGENLNSIDTVNTYFNFDFTSFTNTTNAVTGVCLVNSTMSLACSAGDAKSGVIEIKDPGYSAGALFVELSMSQDANSLTDKPFVADVFSFGAGVNNAIYRLQLEESGDNTATFEGTIEYEMLNQLNINLDATYTDLATIDSDIGIIIEQDMTDEDSPRINFYDLGADGVSTQIADQQEAPTHNGVVSFDTDNYKIADTVVVTLNDQDMNTDSELIDVYTTNSNDLVGTMSPAATSLATGLVLDITFDDLTWVHLLVETTGVLSTVVLTLVLLMALKTGVLSRVVTSG
jgi:hypothetical protein